MAAGDDTDLKLTVTCGKCGSAIVTKTPNSQFRKGEGTTDMAIKHAPSSPWFSFADVMTETFRSLVDSKLVKLLLTTVAMVAEIVAVCLLIDYAKKLFAHWEMFFRYGDV
jgi:hypothetical protein